jgi:hypothetical protein
MRLHRWRREAVLLQELVEFPAPFESLSQARTFVTRTIPALIGSVITTGKLESDAKAFAVGFAREPRAVK